MKGRKLVKKIEKAKEEVIEELSEKMKKLSKDQAIISSAVQYKKSQEIILKKLTNENVAIFYGISLINKKVIENLDKYTEVEKEFNELMKMYQENLEQLAKFHDTQIASEYTKIYKEEKKQVDIQKNIYYLIQKENKAKEKVDNSDDEIREQIYDLEEELSKIELKIRRLKPIIRKKVIEKEESLNKALESQETGIRKDKIKGPKIFSKATKFFMGKLKPYKIIERDIFKNLKNRLEEYENKEKKSKKINQDYLEENIIETINKISEE